MPYTKTSTTGSSVRMTDLGVNTLITQKYSRSRTGVALPKYKEAIAAGLSATTPLTAYDESVHILDNGYATVVKIAAPNKGFVLNMVNPGISLPNPSALGVTVSANTKDAALAKARSKAFSTLEDLQRQSFDAGTFLGELPKTLVEISHLKRGLVDRLARILGGKDLVSFKKRIKQLKNLRRQDGFDRKFRQSADDFANIWLGKQFGLDPLVSDIKNLVEELSTQYDEPRFHTYRFHGGHETVPINQIINTGSALFSNIQYRRLVRARADCYLRVGIRSDWLKDQELVSAMAGISNRTLDVGSALRSFWELTPFSFLTDYFVNVDDVLQGAFVNVNAVAWTSETLTTSVIDIRQYMGILTSGSGYIVTKEAPWAVTTTRKDTTRSGGPLAIPPVYFTLPIKDVKYYNMLALFTTFNLK